MNKTLTSIILIATTFIAANAQSASSIMKSCADKLLAAQSLTGDVRITSGNEAASGSIKVAGEKFIVEFGQQKIVFDGTTQWTIDAANQELSINSPEADELAQINPLTLLNGYANLYKMKLISNDPTAKKAKIELTPKKASDIKKILITVNTGTNLPEQMSVMTDNANFNFNLVNLKLGGNIQPTVFVVNPRQYSTFEIIDLR